MGSYTIILIFYNILLKIILYYILKKKLSVGMICLNLFNFSSRIYINLILMFPHNSIHHTTHRILPYTLLSEDGSVLGELGLAASGWREGAWYPKGAYCWGC